jgi:hypothetical protein
MLSPAAAAQVPCAQCSGTVWYVDASSNDPTPTGTSWAEAFPTLTEAIDAAYWGDCIWVAAGRYYPSSTDDRADTFLIDKGLELYGGFDGSETCFADRAENFSGTRLSGEIGDQSSATDNSYRVITVFAGDPPYVPIGETYDVLIDGFNIRDGYNSNSPNHQGGGIYCSNANKLTLRNCLVRNNQAGDGAGIYVTETQFNIVFTEFIDNFADFKASGLWADTPGDDCYVYNTIFKNNQTDAEGGAFRFESFLETERVRFMNVLFRGNQATIGSGGYVAESTEGEQARAEMVNCTFTTGEGSVGTALHAEESSSLDPGKYDLRNCIAWGNVDPMTQGILDFTDGSGATFGDSEVSYTIVEPDESFWDCDLPDNCFNTMSCTNFACDPLFVGSTNFHLGTGSPAIDSGESTTAGSLLPDVFDFDGDANTTEDVPWDLDGNTRVQGEEIDRGCYETSDS